MINYQDSLQLQINSPLDAKVCNYYRESSEFVIEPITKYLERVIDVYRTAGVLVTVLEAKDGYTPTIGGDGLIRFPLLSFSTELVNFDIKYYTFVDGIADENFQQVTFGYTYVAYASDNIGTGFSLTPSAGLNYTAILVAEEKIDTLEAADFAGLWHRPAVDYTYVSSNDASTDVTGAELEQLSDGSETTLHTHHADNINGLADVATSGDYNDLSNTPVIPDAQVQSDWEEVDTESPSYILNKPEFTGTSPAVPLNSIQFNNNGSFGGSSALTFNQGTSTINFKGSIGSKLFFSTSVFGPQIWTNSAETQFGIANNRDSNIFTLNAGRIALGQTNIEGDTFLQISDENTTPFIYALKLKNSADEPMLAVKNDGNVYLQKLSEATSSQILYIDPTSGLVTRGATPDNTIELTAGASSGIDVNGGNSATETPVEITQNSSKLPTVIPTTSDEVGLYDVSGASQGKTTIGNLPGWNLQVDGVQSQELKPGNTLNIEGGSNVTLDYNSGTLSVNAADNSLDLYVDSELQKEGAGVLDLLSGSGINLTYEPDGKIRIDSTAVLADGLRSGGSVVWLYDYVYAVSLATYVLGGTLYNSPASQVTLSASDPTFPRIDVIVVNDQGAVEVVEGTPASDPQQPSINPTTQIVLTYVLLLAGTSDPAGVSDVLVYDENNEWTTGVVGTTADYNSLTAPFSGSVCGDISDIGDGQYLTFTNDSVASTDFESLSLFFKPKAEIVKWVTLYVQLYNGTTPVSNEVALTVDGSTLEWQAVAVPISSFVLSSNDFNQIRIIWRESKLQPLHAGFYIDFVRLQTGIEQVVVSSSIKLVGDVLANGETGSPIQTTLATVNANPGSYGSGTEIPVLTVDEKGRTTAIETQTVFIPSGDIDVTGGDFTMSGTTGTPITNAALNDVNASPGTIGSASQIPVITTNSKGLVTNVSSAALDLSVIQGDISNIQTELGTIDYDYVSTNDANTDVTGAELEELTDGSLTTLHKHQASDIEDSVTTVLFGFLYNWYAIDSATTGTDIANTGWHVPIRSDFVTLSTYLGGLSVTGGKLKETGFTYWDSPNTGATNETNFNARGSGKRSSTGSYSGNINQYFFMGTGDLYFTSWRAVFLQHDSGAMSNLDAAQHVNTGLTIRLVKDSTTLSHGETGTYTGNDGKVYRTICIGTQEWLAENLAETKYRNGYYIQGYDGGVYTPISDAAWAALTTGALCAYEDELNNVLTTTIYQGVIYTQDEKDKLEGIEDGAEVNVQSDWAEADTEADSYILNRPTIDYSYVSENDTNTDVTAVELEELTDGSETTLHSHASSLDLHINDVLEEAGINNLKLVAGTSITITYDENGKIVIDVTANTLNSVTGDGTAASPIQLVNDQGLPGNSKYYGTNAIGAKGYFSVPQQVSYVQQSITGDGTLGNELSLVNDATSPGTDMYYGTDASGIKGYHDITIPTIVVFGSIQGDGSAGNPLQLSGDVSTPGATMYYGTNDIGVKGFYTIPGQDPIAFTDLTDVIPENYTLKANHVPIVVETEDALDLIDTEEIQTIDAAFTVLADCPSDYTGWAGASVRVNAAATGLEFYYP